MRVVLGALASAALLGGHRQAPQRGLLRWRFLKSRAPTGYSVRTLYRILAGGRPRHLLVFARTSEIAPSVCGGASPRLVRCERGAGMLRSLLGLGLLATLCAAADETLSPTKPSDNALLYFAGDYKTYEFEVLNNNSRVEFRVTLTETANDVLDVYMNYGTPVNDTLAGSGLWAPDPAFTGAPEYTVTSGPVVESTSNEGGADCSAGSSCMLYVISLSPCTVRAGMYYALVVSSAGSTTKAKARYEEVSAELESNVTLSHFVSYHEPEARRWQFYALTPPPDTGAPAADQPFPRSRPSPVCPDASAPLLPPRPLSAPAPPTSPRVASRAQ